jgi:CheY-like chemotaxis protein
MTTWMLLEDEPDLYDMILAMYEVIGIGGVAFGSGEDATDWIKDVEKARYEGELPELALLDIRLPDNINGTMVAQQIRQSPKLRDTVIVMMTAYRLTPAEENELFDITDADYLLYKPLPKLHDLQALLKGLVRKRRNG